MRYDTTLKQLFQTPPARLIVLLTGSPMMELLTVEYPAVKMRRPDLVLRLADGRIHHIELQSHNADNIGYRMFEYYASLWQQFGEPPVQTVLYVGRELLTMKGVVGSH